MDKDQKIKILQDLVQIQSVNGNEKAVALYLQNLLASYGIKSELVDYAEDRSNLVVEIAGNKEGDNKTLAFSGHFDVVDIGDASDWTHPPFEAEIEEGYMYGRGTADMKAGVAATIIALIELHQEGADFSGNLRFLGSMGEEIGMLGSKQLTEAGYTEDIDAMVIAEPTSNGIIFAHKGSIQYEIIATGRSAHSSTPENGVNALNLITEFIQRAEKRFNEKTASIINDELGPMTNSFTVIHGGEQINSIPAKVSLLGNARTIPEFDNDQVVDLISGIMTELNQESEGKLELNVTQNMFPVESSRDSQIIQSVLAASDDDLEVKTIPNATDASNFLKVENDIELAIFSVFDGDQAHVVDEKINVEDYLNSIDTYKQTALNYLT